MSPTPEDDCCGLAPDSQTCPERQPPVPASCPLCQSGLRKVATAAVMRHVTKPIDRQIDGEYRFCPAPLCEAVFVGHDGRVLSVGDLRHPPAYKTANTADLLCYCFDLRGVDFVSDRGDMAVAFISDRIRAKDCACDVLNPSGGCCLGSIARYRKDRRE